MTSIPLYLPFILSPPLTSCTPAYIVYGQGTPPYTIFPIHSGDANGTSLESIPLQASSGVFQWTVDFDPGANLTWALVDGKGMKAFSLPMVVQVGNGGTCAKNDYHEKHTSLGSILAGVLVPLGIIALLISIFFAHRHYLSRHPKPVKPSKDDDESEEVTVGNGSGLVRVGTFNLHRRGVEFNESSVDRLREVTSPPPRYSRATAGGRATTTTTEVVAAESVRDGGTEGNNAVNVVDGATMAGEERRK